MREVRIARAEFTRLWLAGTALTDIAARLNCSARSVSRIAARFNMPHRKCGVVRTHDYQTVAQMYADGVIVRDIAEHVGLPCASNVARIVAAMGLPRRTKSEAAMKSKRITAGDWQQLQLSRSMAATAAAEQAAMINAEMADCTHNSRNKVGEKHARNAA